MKITTEKVREVKWDRKKVARLTKRSNVPPSPAEMNVYSPLHTSQSYSNYGNNQPYGVGGVASNQLAPGGSSSDGAVSGGCGESKSIRKGYKLPLGECLFNDIY